MGVKYYWHRVNTGSKLIRSPGTLMPSPGDVTVGRQRSLQPQHRILKLISF